jgi:hypothetical protein
MVAASTGMMLASNPASNARTRCRPVWRGIEPGGKQDGGVIDQRLLRSPPGDRAARNAQSMKSRCRFRSPPNSKTVVRSPISRQRSLEVIAQLGVADEDDGELPATFGNKLDQTLQRGERLGMQVVGIVDEQGGGGTWLSGTARSGRVRGVPTGWEWRRSCRRTDHRTMPIPAAALRSSPSPGSAPARQ